MMADNGSAPSPFSIGAALDAYDAQRLAERESTQHESPRPDALDDYAAGLSSSAHPPSECGDPYDCAIHGDQYRAYMSRGA